MRNSTTPMRCGRSPLPPVCLKPNALAEVFGQVVAFVQDAQAREIGAFVQDAQASEIGAFLDGMCGTRPLRLDPPRSGKADQVFR